MQTVTVIRMLHLWTLRQRQTQWGEGRCLYELIKGQEKTEWLKVEREEVRLNCFGPRTGTSGVMLSVRNFWFSVKSPVVTIYTTTFNIQQLYVYLCVLCGSENSDYFPIQY